MPAVLRVPLDELPAYQRVQRLAAQGGAREVVPELLAIAVSRERPTAERVAAVRSATYLGAPVDALVDLTLDEDPQVRAVVLDVLGQRADAPVLDRLRHLDEAGTPFVATRLALARALIAHREGLADGPFLPWVDGDAPELGEGAEAVAQEVEDPLSSFDALDPGGYGLEPDGTAYELRCGGSTHLVFADSRARTAEVFRRPLLLGVVAQSVSGSTAVELLVLTRPWEHGARVEVVRPDGVVMHVGTAVPADEGLVFDLTGTGAPGVAVTRISGRLGDGLRVDQFPATRRGSAPAQTVQDARPS